MLLLQSCVGDNKAFYRLVVVWLLFGAVVWGCQGCTERRENDVTLTTMSELRVKQRVEIFARS